MDIIINDSTPNHVLFPGQYATGLDLSGRPEGFAYGGTAEPFPDSLVIPKSDWQGLITERKRLKCAIPDLCDQAGLPVKDQRQTNYCWINAPTHCVEILRVMQGQSKVVLSAASAGAQIKGYRNVGGWGKEGLEWITAHGLMPDSIWPNAVIDRKYATPANQQLALNYRNDEWWELQPNNLDHLVSCVLRNIPVAVGYNWWSHEVTAVDVDWLDGAVALIIDNSWGQQWGTNGRGKLQGRKMLPDDAVAPRTVKAYQPTASQM